MTPARHRLARLVALPVLVVIAVLATIVTAGPVAADTDPVGSWPLRPRPEVMADFDPPDSPFGPGHRGVDLAGSPGQRVRAALPGRVSFAAGLAGRGVVVVDHGATRTTYEPVAATVRVGDEVPEGAVLGRLQLGGSHCFPRACLHWGWIRGETYLDPLRLVGLREVRLLPLGGLQAGVAPLPVMVPWTLSSLAQARGCACW
jgi:murein DD-endopeptidase MepM/ murein hydrolase activator NlpD